MTIINKNMIFSKIYVIFERRRIINAFFIFAILYFEKKCKRRFKTIDAISMFCDRQKIRQIHFRKNHDVFTVMNEQKKKPVIKFVVFVSKIFLI